VAATEGLRKAVGEPGRCGKLGWGACAPAKAVEPAQ